MKNIPAQLARTLTWILSFSLATGLVAEPASKVTVNSSTNQFINATFDAHELELRTFDVNGQSQARFSLADENLVDPANLPVIPSLSTCLIVPPQAAIELEATPLNSARITAGVDPESFVASAPNITGSDNQGLYPPVVAEMSEPFIVRGIRMVTVTVYPVQYDLKTGEYIHHRRVDVRLNFTDKEPVNPVIHNQPRSRSSEFQRMLCALADNADQYLRDEGEIGRDYVGHYLVVAHDSCLQFAIPLIEWKRRAGYKMDIFRLSHEEAQDVNFIREGIQGRYDACLDEGIDPFNYILLIGDRPSEGHANAPWNLYAPRGNQSMPDVTWHADYEYALLEGDDFFPDAAIGRLASGNRNMMELAVERLLSYEGTPWLDETD